MNCALEISSSNHGTFSFDMLITFSGILQFLNNLVDASAIICLSHSSKGANNEILKHYLLNLEFFRSGFV